MPVKAKYIKDLPLKEVLDGSESLLVQDLNGTQQAPLGTIVDEIKQNSQEKIREIESELAQTNEQLSKKANVSDVRRNDVAIKLEDLHTEVKTAMTGGSVAVVGENAVGKENIKSKAVDFTKIDDTVATASLVNLFNTNFRTKVNGMSATTSESEGIYSVVTSESYGRLDITLDNVVGSSKFLMMCKVRATDSTSVNKSISLICYNYSSTDANLGQNYSGPAQPLTSDWRTIIATDIVLNEQATRGVFGVLSPNSSYQVKDIVICRIDDIPSEMLKLIDFKKIGNGYWYSSMGGYHPVSMVSNHSQYSELAKTVEDGAITPQKLSQTYLTGCTNVIKTSDYRGTKKNGATVSYDESTGIHTITSNTTYGTFNRRLSTKEGKRYVMISEVRSTTNEGLAVRDTSYCHQGNTNLGNSVYTNVTVNVSSEWSIHVTKVIESIPNADTIDIGLYTSVNGASFEVRRQFIFDVTNLRAELVENVDFETFIADNNWEDNLNYPMYSVISGSSEKAKNSEYAETSGHSATSSKSELAEVANYALDGNFVKPITKYTNIMGDFNKITENNNVKVWGNGAKFNVLKETKEIEVTPTASWGELLLWTPVKSGETDTPIEYNRRYKFVAKVKAPETCPVKCTCFMYSQDGTQLGSQGGHQINATPDYQYVMWDFTVSKEETYKVAIGITNRKEEPYITYTVKDLMLIDITDENLSDQKLLFLGGYWSENPQIVETANKSLIAEKAMSLDESCVLPGTSKWKGKTALVIGDSITAAKKWQKKLKEDLEMTVKTHAKGGIGILAMVDGDKGLQGDYDNETNASGTLYPLNTNDMTGVDLIVVLPAYNERGKEEGVVGDVYPNKSTITGLIQYMINRIYEELAKANNLNCKVLFATPHCAGKYGYIDADGYEEYPSNSGQTMETLSDAIKLVCNYNNIPVCDLWHNSGINRFTWSIYGANPNAVNDQYTKYKLDAQGQTVGTTPLKYVKGQSYYQNRNGQVVLEEYTGSSPYPFNGDQLHCSDLGYARIGECIVGTIIKAYGY